MAIQAQLYSENYGFSLEKENACGFDDLCLIPPQPHQQLDQFQNFSHQKNLNNSIESHNQQPLASVSIEQFINLQNERLRIAMQEQGKQQTALLMEKYEWRSRMKDEEIAKAAQRTMELQNLLQRMETESQRWQRVAEENEAIVASLNGTIRRLREDAESCCQEKGQLMCKCCNSRTCCVVILPCRHLCSCTHCEVFLDSCPVCAMEEKTSIQALIC